MLLVALVLSLSLQQSPPAAPPPVRSPDTAPPATVVVAEDRAAAAPTQVCRMEPVTGSRFGRRVCRSTVQTDEERAESREMLRRLQGSRVPPVG